MPPPIPLVLSAHDGRGPWRSSGWPHPVIDAPCGDDDRYEAALRSLWRADADLIVVEHDIAAESTHMATLADCPAVLCAWAYLVYPISSGLPNPVFPHRNYYGAGPMDWAFVEEGEAWADEAAFGFSKLGRLARREVGGWAPGGWQDLDQRVAHAFREAGLRWHLHWPPVPHHHLA